MAVYNAFNIGKDASVSIELYNLLGRSRTRTTVAANSEDLGLLQSFNAKPEFSTNTRRPVTHHGVITSHATLQGYVGVIAIVRQDDTLEQLVHLMQENQYYGGGNVKANITHTVQHPKGLAYGKTIWVYPGCTLWVEDEGTWEGSNSVVQKLNFIAPRRYLGDSDNKGAVASAFNAAASRNAANKSHVWVPAPPTMDLA